VSSKRAAAQYANPFGFSLQAVESAQKLVLNVQGTDVAEVGCFFLFPSTLLLNLILPEA